MFIHVRPTFLQRCSQVIHITLVDMQKVDSLDQVVYWKPAKLSFHPEMLRHTPELTTLRYGMFQDEYDLTSFIPPVEVLGDDIAEGEMTSSGGVLAMPRPPYCHLFPRDLCGHGAGSCSS